MQSARTITLACINFELQGSPFIMLFLGFIVLHRLKSFI